MPAILGTAWQFNIGSLLGPQDPIWANDNIPEKSGS